MRILFLLLISSVAAFGQCGILVLNPVTFNLDCTGPAASGTVTSAQIAGTANQINVTGTCTITTTGTCTLSIPSSPTFPGTVTAGGSFVAGNASFFIAADNGGMYWNSRSVLVAPSDGVIKLSNNAQTDFARLQLGGTTSSFPSIKRSATVVAFRLADDSADAPISASTASLSGKVTTYNNIATVAGGTPSILAVADLTAQSAAKTATALYTPAATGLYRVSYYAKVTTAATNSSILGGTTGLVLAYTDGTDSVAQTAFTLPEDNQAGSALAVGTGNTTNTTQAVVHGTAIIYALTGVGITYAFGYTSVGVTAMQYELHITLEAL